VDDLVLLLEKYRYLILFPLSAVEGPLVSLAVGFLISLGYLDFFFAYPIVILGDIIPDSIYYYVGRLGNKNKLLERFRRRSKFISGNLHVVENLWQEHGRKTMLLGKLAYGLSVPFLISAGLVDMPFRRFLSYAIPVTLFQYGMIIAIGYTLGHSYRMAGRYIEYSYLILAAIWL
jgi:membrane-associated protein